MQSSIRAGLAGVLMLSAYAVPQSALAGGAQTNVTQSALRISAHGRPTLSALSFSGIERGWAGGTGVILGTVDGGRIWRTEWRGTGNVTEIAPVPGSGAFAVTGTGLLRMSSRGGGWKPTLEPGGDSSCALDLGAPCIVSVDFPTARTGYAIAAAPLLAGTGPQWVALSPHGHWLYTTNSSGTVTAYDLRTKHLMWYVAVGQAPGGIAVSPDGRTLYVANQNSGTVSVIDTATHRVTATIAVGQNPCAVAVAPGGGKVFVASISGGLSVIDARTLRQVDVLPVGGSCGMAFSPSGKRLYVATSSSSTALDVVNPRTDTIIGRISGLGGAADVAVSPDGSRLYVSNTMGSSVLVLNAHTGQQLAAWPTPGLPYGIALDQSHNLVFVSSGQWIVAYDASTGREVGKVTTSYPSFGNIAVAPGSANVYTAGSTQDLEISAKDVHATLITASGSPVNATFGTPIPISGGVLYTTTDAGSAWRRVATPVEFQSVCFTTASKGFAAVGATVYATGNAGRTWHTDFRAPLQPGAASGSVTAVFCHGRSVAIEIGAMGAAMGHAGYIAFVSTDGGRHWTASIEENYTHPGRQGVNAPEGPGSYPGPLTLTASGEPVYAGWTPAANSAGVGQRSGPLLVARQVSGVAQIAAIAFPTSSVGWLLTKGAGAGTILHTVNGGRTWVPQYPSGPAPIYGISFPTPSVGYGLGTLGDVSAVLWTSDGGGTWTTVSHLPTPPGPYVATSIAFSSASVGYAASISGTLYRTTDGGRTWTLETVPATFVAADGRYVCASGSSGEMGSNDYGRSWTKLGSTAAASQFLFACAAALGNPALKRQYGVGPANSAMMEGAIGSKIAWFSTYTALYRTGDGGRSWDAYVYPAVLQNDEPVNFSFPSQAVGYILTNGGYLYRTTDGGASWIGLP